MPDPDTVLLLVMRDPSGNLLLVDAKGTQRLAGSGADLWHACHEILNDPDVPRHEHVGGDQALAEEAVTEFVAAHLPPGLHRLAPMAVSVGLEGLRSFGSIGNGIGLDTGRKRRKKGRR